MGDNVDAGRLGLLRIPKSRPAAEAGLAAGPPAGPGEPGGLRSGLDLPLLCREKDEPGDAGAVRAVSAQSHQRAFLRAGVPQRSKLDCTTSEVLVDRSLPVPSSSGLFLPRIHCNISYTRMIE